MTTSPRLASSDKNGNALSGRSGLSSLSADGNLVTFTNLTGEGTSSSFYQVELKNLATGDLTEVGASLGVQTQFSRFSADGGIIVFEAAADGAFEAEFNNIQIYTYDVSNGDLALVTRSTSGTESDGGLFTNPSIADGGRIVSFDSDANDLVSGYAFASGLPFNNHDNVYVYSGGKVSLISQKNGTLFDDNSWNSYVSENGKFVAFESFASNIGLGAKGHEDEVYLYNVATKKLTLVSKTAAGVVANGNDNGAPILSASGRYVIFISAATNLAPGATSGKDQIYWKDTVTGQLKLVSCDAQGAAGNGSCSYDTPEGVNYPAISADGRFVTFASNSNNLVPGVGPGNTNGNGNNVVYVKDMITGAIAAVSQLTVDSVDPSISADGNEISFTNNNSGASGGGFPANGQIYIADNEMAVFWKKAASGKWESAANWTPAGIPNAIDDVFITVGGTAYTVTTTGDQTIAMLSAAANTTLVLDDGMLKIDKGTGLSSGTASLDGAISIRGGGVLEIGAGTLNNTGSIALSGVVLGEATLKFDENVAVQGGGTITLSDNQDNDVVSTSGFTNADNTIQGAGSIEGPFRNGADGIVDATGNKNDLKLLNQSGGAAIVNDGILESTANAGLEIDSGVTNNGQIFAKAGGVSLKGDLTGNGAVLIGNNAFFQLDGVSDATVQFDDNTVGIFAVDQPDKFTGTIDNLAAGDTIELSSAALKSEFGTATVSHAQISGTSLIVTLQTGDTLTYQLGPGNYGNSTFAVDALPGNRVGLVFHDASPQIETGIAGSGYLADNPYVDSLVWGWGKWDSADPITYWFGNPADSAAALGQHGQTLALHGGTLLDTWTAAAKSAFQTVFDQYAAVSGLSFAPATSAAAANLVFWAMPSITENPNILGQAEVPAQHADGTIWLYFNDRAAGWANRKIGGDGLYTITHELGHSLGLAHPHDGGYEPDDTLFPGVTGAQSIGTDGQNQAVFSEMSYVRGWNGATTTNLVGGQSGPGAFDIAALQQLYGANTAYHTGDDTYTLPRSNIAGTGWVCIWDAGGSNTISNGTSSDRCIIDLRAAPLTGPNAGGYISHDLGISGGFTIANGVVIDGGAGGTGNDVVVTNGDADTIDGGLGFDTVEVFGQRDDFDVAGTKTAATVTAHNGDVTDTLTNVEAVAFSPSKDPFPGAGGVLEATGNGLDVLAPITVNATIDAGSLLELASTDSGKVTFSHGTEALILDKSATFKSRIAGFGGADTIDLLDIPYVSGQSSTTYKPLAPNTGGTLTVSDQAGHSASINFAGRYTLANFNIQDDHHGDTLISDPPAEAAAGKAATGAALPGIDLFSNYIAAMFATPPGETAATPVASSPAATSLLIAKPHAG